MEVFCSSNRQGYAPCAAEQDGGAGLNSMLADVMLNIGTLPAGESVMITFNVTVDDPFGGALPQVSNQGTVSGTNFADVLTDDPTVGGTADPTVTPIDFRQFRLAVSPASVLEDGATNLVYTFTRTGSTASAMTVNFSVGWHGLLHRTRLHANRRRHLYRHQRNGRHYPAAVLRQQLRLILQSI